MAQSIIYMIIKIYMNICLENMPQQPKKPNTFWENMFTSFNRINITPAHTVCDQHCNKMNPKCTACWTERSQGEDKDMKNQEDSLTGRWKIFFSSYLTSCHGGLFMTDMSEEKNYKRLQNLQHSSHEHRVNGMKVLAKAVAVWQSVDSPHLRIESQSCTDFLFNIHKQRHNVTRR